jgi:hypothetical protein
MGDRLEPLTRSRIAEDERRQTPAIEGSVAVENLRSEGLRELRQPVRALGDDLPCKLVRVDDREATRPPARGHAALSRGESPREAEQK